MILNKIKNGWTLSKTLRQKPTGYRGHGLTIYDKDDVTIIHEFFAKTLKGIEKQYKKANIKEGR